MARLESNAKMGFYPTPVKTLQLLRRWFAFEENAKALDPCCGTGEALESVTKGRKNVVTYGVELDNERADTAMGRLNYAATGSIFDARINPLASVGMLYLNPPYDSNDGERVEMQFLKHASKWLSTNGVLVFLVPEFIFNFEKYRIWIARHFGDIRIARIHSEEYPVFKQAVLFAKKKRDDLGITAHFPGRPYEYLEDVSPVDYAVPYTDGPEIFQGTSAVTDADILSHTPTVLKDIDLLAGNRQTVGTLRPLLPLRRGHLVSLITAGIIDGVIDSIDGPMIVKGFHDRKKEVRLEDDIEITKETFNVGIRIMEPEKGTWYDIK